MEGFMLNILLNSLFVKIASIGFALAFASYFIIFGNKAVIPKLPGSMASFKKLWSTVTKPLIKHHRKIGVVAYFAIAAHGIWMIVNGMAPLSGILILAPVTLAMILVLYKKYFNKKAALLNTHIVLMMVTAVALVWHYIQFD